MSFAELATFAKKFEIFFSRLKTKTPLV